MALQKAITLENGIVVNYHRIASINKVTNNINIIEVASYINQEQREIEKEKIEKGEPMNIFIHTSIISTEYDENTNIKNDYDFLKETEMFKGAIDV